MRNFESGSFDFYSNREKPSGGERERASELDDIDLRPESEVFQDHERIDSKDLDDQLIALRDQLSKDTGGIIHIDIPAYRYDFADNPFVGMGPNRTKTYEISRYVDIVFLHRFMYQEIIVCGLQSRKFTNEARLWSLRIAAAIFCKLLGSKGVTSNICASGAVTLAT